MRERSSLTGTNNPPARARCGKIGVEKHTEQRRKQKAHHGTDVGDDLFCDVEAADPLPLDIGG